MDLVRIQYQERSRPGFLMYSEEITEPDVTRIMAGLYGVSPVFLLY